MVTKKFGSAAAIFDCKGNILMVKHDYGKFNWELPGGHAELNESLGETAVREVLEETGLRVITERLTGLYYETYADMHHTVFICRKMDELAIPNPSSPEISECRYWNVNALPRPISSFTIQRIRDAIAPVSYSSFHIVQEREWFE